MDSNSNVIKELDYVVGKWQVCQSCRVVDDDCRRSTVGYACPICGVSGDGGVMYFDMSVHLIIDLIKEAFLTEHKIENKGTDYEYQINTHYISVLIFFCTLREILLNRLIREICFGLKLPKGVYNQLIMDNKMHVQKQDKLFASLTGVKWLDALKRLCNEDKSDYVAVNNKISDLVKLRNRFIHKGHGWGITQEHANDCVRTIAPLIHMYVRLHNEFVHKMFSKNE